MELKLINSIKAGDALSVINLINNNDNINRQFYDFDEKTIVYHYLACEKENRQIFDILLRNNFDFRSCDAYGISPLHISAQIGDSYCFFRMIKKLDKKYIQNLYDDYNDSVYHYACHSDSIKIIRYFHKNYSKEYICENGFNGFTNFHYACMNNKLKTLKYLLECNICRKNKYKLTKGAYNLAHISCEGGSYDTTKYLWECEKFKYMFKEKTNDRKCVMYLALMSENLKLIKFLIIENIYYDQKFILKPNFNNKILNWIHLIEFREHKIFCFLLGTLNRRKIKKSKINKCHLHLLNVDVILKKIFNFCGYIYYKKYINSIKNFKYNLIY